MFLVGDPYKTSFATDTVGGGTTQVIVSCSDYLLYNFSAFAMFLRDVFGF